jgi:hypothetical protein
MLRFSINWIAVCRVLARPHYRAGANPRIVASITEATPVEHILNYIGEPAEPPPIASARGPPARGEGLVDDAPDWDALPQPEPEYVFDQ